MGAAVRQATPGCRGFTGGLGEGLVGGHTQGSVHDGVCCVCLCVCVCGVVRHDICESVFACARELC